MTEEELKNLKEITTICNNCRGRYISVFTILEHLLATIVIEIDYEGNPNSYYKSFKTANTIYIDFWKAFDRIKHNLNGKLNYEFTFQSDLERLLEHRNILAHWLLMTDNTYIENFNGESIWLYSWKGRQDHLREYSYRIVDDLIHDLSENLNLISQIQQDVYIFLKKPNLL